MIRVLVRHCNSINSKARPDWFDKQKVFQNLVSTLDDRCSLTVLFDGDPTNHFVAGHPVSIVRFKAGSDAGSFRKTLSFAEKQQSSWRPEDIVYFVEDDYVHRPGWPQIIREAFDAKLGDLVSVYDHRDKYDGKQQCQLSFTRSCHWRSTPSTTNTFAVRYGTLLQDLDLYKRFADPVRSAVCIDHERFLALLSEKGRRLVSSVPGFATHCENEYLSPCLHTWLET